MTQRFSLCVRRLHTLLHLYYFLSSSPLGALILYMLEYSLLSAPLATWLEMLGFLLRSMDRQSSWSKDTKVVQTAANSLSLFLSSHFKAEIYICPQVVTQCSSEQSTAEMKELLWTAAESCCLLNQPLQTLKDVWYLWVSAVNFKPWRHKQGVKCGCHGSLSIKTDFIGSRTGSFSIVLYWGGKR